MEMVASGNYPFMETVILSEVRDTFAPAQLASLSCHRSEGFQTYVLDEAVAVGC